MQTFVCLFVVITSSISHAFYLLDSPSLSQYYLSITPRPDLWFTQGAAVGSHPP